jgi:hypothetical protein
MICRLCVTEIAPNQKPAKKEFGDGTVFYAHKSCARMLPPEERADWKIGSGWYGDKEAHAAAGRQGGAMSSGNFKHDPDRARAVGSKGGSNSPGNFKHDPERARLMGQRRHEKVQEA